MSPTQFKKARESQRPTTIYSKPYDPTLHATSSPSSIISTTLALLFPSPSPSPAATASPPPNAEQLTVTTITGGITNTLYRVSGLSPKSSSSSSSSTSAGSTPPKPPLDSVLVRIFGAEGMIDRDVETSTFARLAEEGVEFAPEYLGRFGNGRLEGWMEGYDALRLKDLQDEEVGVDIMQVLARLHYSFRVPEELREWHDESKPGLWVQLFAWMEQAEGITEYETEGDGGRAEKLLDLPKVASELDWLKNEVIPEDSTVGFCHNDLLAGNIMKDGTGRIQLIDFEYGGVNYVAFDIANHFNEYAGGTSTEENGVPDYTLLPSPDRQRGFINKYLLTRNSDRGDIHGGERHFEEVDKFFSEVRGFMLANHLYWGLWAVNQASAEGTEEFDYMTYASNRFKQYYIVKEEQAKEE